MRGGARVPAALLPRKKPNDCINVDSSQESVEVESEEKAYSLSQSQSDAAPGNEDECKLEVEPDYWTRKNVKLGITQKKLDEKFSLKGEDDAEAGASKKRKL